MALSRRATDVLGVLDAGSMVDTDTDDELTLEVRGRLTSSTLTKVYAAAGPDTHGVIDFEHMMLRLTRQPIHFASKLTFKSMLRATTEGEREAVAFADKLTVIDVDDLIPSWRLETTDCTNLHIGRLMCVSHDALLKQVPSGVPFYYDLKKKDIVVQFPLTNKRKR